ncbi:MAG TPA: DUF1549 domain-containing protein [Planctomycetota bacterium]|nr:DUF1549 domain-containing protein [Planctomycetota bacterium]
MRFAPFGLLLLLPAFARQQDTPTVPSNPIDAYFSGVWNSKGVKPAGPADDIVFFRRLHIDLFGRGPSPDEIRAWMKDKAADKRAKLVDRMIAADECSEFFADVWLDALIDHSMTYQDFLRADVGPLRRWLRASFHEDVPYDRIVRSLLSDRGSRRDNPAVNFLLKHLNGDPVPVKLAVMSARLFLGRDIRCAQCHDHPFDELTQEEFWGYMEFFRPLRNAGDLVERPAPPTGMKRDDFGEMRDVKPRFLDGRAPLPEKSLGQSLAELTLTTKDKECSRAFINRTWRHFFGKRLVSTPAEKNHDALAATLAERFEREEWSIRKLLKTIVTSKVYQLESKGKEAERILYAVGPLKPMGPLQFMKAYTDAFNLHEMHRRAYVKMENNPETGENLKDPEVLKVLFYTWARDLLLPHGRDPEEDPAYGTPRMAMKFMNNQRVQSMINATWKEGLLGQVLAKKSKPQERIEELTLALLGRPPTKWEKEEFGEHLKGRFTFVGEGYEDIFWVLLNSTEFLFVH